MTAQNAVNTITNLTLVTTTETVVAVLPALGEALPGGGGFLISGIVNLTPGTAATGVIMRVRAGSTTAGAQIGNADTHTVAAAAAQNIPFYALDGAGPRAGNQYCVTAQQVAATGNATVNDVTMMLDVVSPGG